MEIITYIDGLVTYRGYDYPYESCEKIDDTCVHISMGAGVYAITAGNTVINNVLCNSADEIIAIFEA
jgi:hypothetical protein